MLTRLLTDAAAPIAGLSAATFAYGAAAMLPVWLPSALGRRRKRSVVMGKDDNLVRRMRKDSDVAQQLAAWHDAMFEKQ